MGKTLNNFRSEFFGVRPNRFLIETSTEGNELLRGLFETDTLYVYVKAADLPGSTIGTIPVAWQGRVVKFSGERMYADWSINCYESNIPDTDLREGFERWMELMDTREGHAINYNLTLDWIVKWSDISAGTQRSTGSLVDGTSQDSSDFNKAIKLKNCFPTDVGSVTLNYDLSDSFSEFTITMAYDYWEPVPVII